MTVEVGEREGVLRLWEKVGVAVLVLLFVGDGVAVRVSDLVGGGVRVSVTLWVLERVPLVVGGGVTVDWLSMKGLAIV